MKKIYIIFMLTVFSLNAQNSVQLEVLQPYTSSNCNNNIKVTVLTDNPGDPYAGANSTYDFWSIRLKLDNSSVFFTKVGSRAFVPISNGKYKYTFTANVKKSLQGNLVKATIERTTYIGSSITFHQGKFYSNEYNWCLPVNPDIDGDGVLNVNDKCLNVFGKASNFGCPGNPDLVVDVKNTYEYSDCNACNGPLEFVQEGFYRPVIYRYGGNITFNPLVFKNIGDGDVVVGSVKIRFFLSKDKNLDNKDIGFGNRTFDLQPLKAGESSPTRTNHSYGASIEGSDIGNRAPYGKYYLLISIDQPNRLGNSESNINNNVHAVPVKYTGTLPSIEKPEEPFELEWMKYNNTVSAQKPQELYIYQFNGNFIKKVVIKNEEGKKEILSKLPKGLYILNSSRGSSEKIYVDN